MSCLRKRESIDVEVDSRFRGNDNSHIRGSGQGIDGDLAFLPDSSLITQNYVRTSLSNF